MCFRNSILILPIHRDPNSINHQSPKFQFRQELQSEAHPYCSGILPGCLRNSFFTLKIKEVFLLVGIIQIERTVMNLSATLAEVINNTISALNGIESNLNSMSQILMGNCIALDFLLSSYGGVRDIGSTSTCIWINETDNIEWLIYLTAYGTWTFGLGWAIGVPNSKASYRD